MWSGVWSDMHIVVVGAGLGGLSAAAHLCQRGHQVTVLERDAVPGGRAGVIAEAGFRLDTGPSALTMPDVLAATFAAAGSDLADFVRLHPVDPMYRAVFGDGSVHTINYDVDRETFNRLGHRSDGEILDAESLGL